MTENNLARCDLPSRGFKARESSRAFPNMKISIMTDYHVVYWGLRKSWFRNVFSVGKCLGPKSIRDIQFGICGEPFQWL